MLHKSICFDVIKIKLQQQKPIKGLKTFINGIIIGIFAKVPKTELGKFMQIDNLSPISANAMQLLLDSGRYIENVIFHVDTRSFAIVLYDKEQKVFTHGLSYKQRAEEGRAPGIKWYKSWPEKDLKNLNLLKDRSDLVLSVIDHL